MSYPDHKGVMSRHISCDQEYDKMTTPLGTIELGFVLFIYIV